MTIHNICKKMNLKTNSKIDYVNIKLDAESVKSICNIIALIDDEMLKKISFSISMFCLEKSNLDLFIENLQDTTFHVAKQLNQQFEEYCSQISGDLMNKLENEIKEEYKIYKIFKIIKQLFEKSYASRIEQKNNESEKKNITSPKKNSPIMEKTVKEVLEIFLLKIFFLFIINYYSNN